jgi:hypothetical protein
MQSDLVLIDISQLRSYKSTPLEKKWPLFRAFQSWDRAKVEEHLSIHPAQHPLYVNAPVAASGGFYQPLHLCEEDKLQLSLKSHVCVGPVFRMDWRNAERYFHKGDKEMKEVESHWRLDGDSMKSVLELANRKVKYVPSGRQYVRLSGACR